MQDLITGIRKQIPQVKLDGESLHNVETFLDAMKKKGGDYL
jgi:hypothetical protein